MISVLCFLDEAVRSTVFDRERPAKANFTIAQLSPDQAPLYYRLFYTIDCRQRQAVNPNREGYARVGLCIYIQYIVGDARNVFPLWCVVL